MTGLILEAHTVFTPLSDAALEALHPLNKKVYMRVHGAMISDWTRETEQSYKYSIFFDGHRVQRAVISIVV